MEEKIGIISDTHDNIPRIEKAVEAFNKEDVSLVIHVGDYIAPFSLRPLEKLKCEYCGIFGNNDGEKKGLGEKSGGRIKEGPLVLERCGRHIVVVHDISSWNKLRECDILIYGHTHSPSIEKESGRLIINPGECGGWLTGKFTIALLYLKELRAEIVEI